MIIIFGGMLLKMPYLPSENEERIVFLKHGPRIVFIFEKYAKEN
jgi:hypothetical protein